MNSSRNRKIVKWLFFSGFIFALLCVIFGIFVNVYMVSFAKQFIYSDINEVPSEGTSVEAAMILGAGVTKSGTISFPARDRCEAALELYEANLVKKIIISGDHGSKIYDEVNSMKNYIKIMHHIKDEDIFLDHAGFSTYESMYRGRDVFLMNDFIVVTQEFHMARSIYIARKLGLNAYGYVAKEITPFSKATHAKWNVREFLARVKSFFLVAFNAKPTFLGDEIPISGDGRNSWY